MRQDFYVRLCRMALLTAVAAAVGCASSPPPQAAPLGLNSTLSKADYATFKARFIASNPDARVGRVAAVLPAQKRLAVSDLSPADFHPGDYLSIADRTVHPLADATVVQIEPDLIYVTYSPATVGSRPPVVGDLAIRPQPADGAK